MPYPNCDVCGKNESIGVYASSCGPISFAYCKKCALEGAEPYGAIVSYISGAVSKGEDASKEENKISPAYQDVIDISLLVANKTREEFYADINRALEEEKKYYDAMDLLAKYEDKDEDGGF